MQEIEILTQKELAPQEMGAMFTRIDVPVLLRQIELMPGIDLLKIVAGPHQLTKAEDQTWLDVLKLANIRIEGGVFVNLHVKNVGEETKVFGAVIHVDAAEQAASPRVHQAEVVMPGQPVQVAPAPQQSAMPAPTAQQQQVRQGGGFRQSPQGQGEISGGVMKILPPIFHGSKAPATVPQAVTSQGARNGQTTSRPVQKSQQTVERVLPRVEHHKATPKVSANAQPAQIPVNVQGAKSVPTGTAIVQGAAIPTTAEQTEVINNGHAVRQKRFHQDGLDMQLPNGDERAVPFLKGHARGILKMLTSKAPINKAFIGSIINAMTTAMKTPQGAVSGGTSQIVVNLKPGQMSALSNIMARAQGARAQAHPACASLAESFSRAITMDEAASQAVLDRRAGIFGQPQGFNTQNTQTSRVRVGQAEEGAASG